ncbi:MAG: SDR family oxidoreductase [Thermoleophilaceae bacterium]
MATKIAVTGATGRLGSQLVDVLEGQGHEVVPIARSKGVDVITGQGLVEALHGVDVVVDLATGPSPDEKEATEFFTTSTRNLQEAGVQAGVKRIVLVSIIGIDKFKTGYNAAKVAQEKAALAGSIPTRIVRAAQFHEFVEQLLDWGRQGDVAYVAAMRTQVVAARALAEVLAELVTDSEPIGPTLEVAGPRAERLVDLARLLVAERGESLQVSETTEFFPEGELYDSDAPLPGPDAKLVGPTYEDWLKAA